MVRVITTTRITAGWTRPGGHGRVDHGRVDHGRVDTAAWIMAGAETCGCVPYNPDNVAALRPDEGEGHERTERG